jgi:hypothetical protein
LQTLLEKLNKGGVLYKPAAAPASDDNNNADEDDDSFENGPYEKKEFMYKDESDHDDACVEPIIDLTLASKSVDNNQKIYEEVCWHI